MEKASYKNPALSPKERAKDLLGRMTTEEKAAQMDMIRGVELATKVHEAHFCAVDEASDFYWDKVEQSIGKRGMGFVHDVYSVPAVLNRLQKYMVEETRLGIPCIFTGEALHGLSWPGATVFPMPIALGAAFDPALTKEVGHAIAAETRSLGIHEILAPNLDLARELRWGRVEETFGEESPSGRLPVSFPKNVGCLPCYYSMLPGGSPAYLEGERKERFAFGFGLSYTTFAYSDLQAVQTGGPCDWQVSLTVENTGGMAADEVVQLYVEDVYSSVVTPEKLLQGFRRISLAPGEKKRVVFSLDFDSFKLFNKKYEWVVEAGKFRIMAGAGSRDIRLTTDIRIEENIGLCTQKNS